MRTFFVFLAGALTIAACAPSSSAPLSPSRPVDSFGALNGARIDVTAEGGIAALSTNWRATHDDRSFSYSRRHLCSSTCPAPMDSASGVMSAVAADSLFSVIWGLGAMQLRDDYGTTHGAADMFEYTLHVTFEGVTKTVHADDGTMPSAMRQILDIVRGVIDSARAGAK